MRNEIRQDIAKLDCTLCIIMRSFIGFWLFVALLGTTACVPASGDSREATSERSLSEIIDEPVEDEAPLVVDPGEEMTMLEYLQGLGFEERMDLGLAYKQNMCDPRQKTAWSYFWGDINDYVYLGEHVVCQYTDEDKKQNIIDFWAQFGEVFVDEVFYHHEDYIEHVWHDSLEGYDLAAFETVLFTNQDNSLDNYSGGAFGGHYVVTGEIALLLAQFAREYEAFYY
jgi:hypothetical protein